MTIQKQVYRCNVCGNIVEVLHAGKGELVCCGQPMELLQEKTADVGLEKHVPVVETNDRGIKVKVGDVPHPMEEKHYIEWVEIFTDGGGYRKFLKPGDKPEAEFETSPQKTAAREYGRYNITVNVVCPGATQTYNVEKLNDKIKQAMLSTTLLGKFADPIEIANVALFLASDESSFITGQVFIADGGRCDKL